MGHLIVCGIAGQLFFDASRPVDRARIAGMTEVLAHRGPDDAGLYLDGPVGLGFRRLSIIDLSPAGHQPMANEDESLWLACNGEIYNFVALREELRRRGHVFRSATDIETILHGYEEWGEDILARLNGMFAFALWDARDQKLLLARDPFGIKPLHYAVLSDVLVFGSEIKALLMEPAVPRDLDAHALWNYLTFAQVPAPETIYRGIRKLPPGHLLRCRRGRIEIKRYYELPKERPVRADPSELAGELRRRLEAAVQTHLVADVPVGCFLSGGLDSSLIAALCLRHHSGPLQTFSVTFEDWPEMDESAYQRIISEALGTEHHVLRARPSLAQLVEEMVRATDEPFGVASFVPLYCLARMAREHVKVILSGDGSDELFAGYAERYQNDTRRLWVGRTVRPWLGRRKLGDWIWRNRTVLARLWRRGHLAGCGELERYVTSYNLFWGPEKRVLLQPAILEAIASDYGDYVEQAYDSELPTTLERKLRYEMLTTLADEMMTKTDRACSAVSLEGRVPFLDRGVVEFAWSIHPSVHWQRGVGKRVLKAAARGLVPDSIIHRRKHGFSVPVSRWLREDPRFLRPFLLEPDPAFEAWIRPEAVRAMLRAHDSGAGNLGDRLWVLYVLKVWMAQRGRHAPTV